MSIKREVVEKALSKPAVYGPDIDISKYKVEEPAIGELSEDKLDEPVAKAVERVSFSSKSLGYLQVNETALYKVLEKQLSRFGARIMPLKIALEKYDIAHKFSWKIIRPDTDKYTAAAYLYGGEIGYFIYIPPKTKVPIPIYSCLAITGNKKIQFAHNIVYVDEGSEAHVVTGCAVPHGVSEGLHIGISEFYIARNAKLTFTMIHAWAEGLHVRPRTSVIVEEGGEYVSYYVIYSPIASIQTFPIAYLSRRGKAYLATITAASGKGIYDLGSKTILENRNSSSEIISRVVARDKAKVYSRADIEAHESDTRGHIECLGLLLSNEAMVSSIPVITSKKPGALLSHEAAIGMIAEKELEYLMSKGFTEDEARSVLIRGFMNVDAPGIPLAVRREIDRILDLVTKYAVG